MAMEVAGAVRNAYNAEGRMFVVAGQTLYQITPGGVSVPLGTIPGVGRVSFSHNQITNGNEILINNGNAGYIYNTVTQVFQRITDTSYPGGLRAVFINNRFVQIEPARRYVFNSDLADGLNYNALDRFTSETSPDLVMGIESIGNQLAVFSSTTTEWFEDTGANPQPFRSTGIVADKGAAGPFCTAKLDNQLFFLADDGVFYRYQGYNPVRISTKPIEQSIRNKNWFNAFTTVWEDSGYAVCYWTFPDGLTWGYDASTGKWHRRESYGFNRWRLNSLTYWQNKWYGGDFQAGKLYELDWDYILEGDQEFISYRSAGAISDNQNRVIHERLELIVNTGMRETDEVGFVDQPQGPSLTGEAPNPVSGDPFSFAYTATPGDAPIARTVLRDGSYVLLDGVQTAISGSGGAGYQWNQSTATISAADPVADTVVHLNLRTYDTSGLYADHTDEFFIVQNTLILVTGNQIGSGPYWATAVGVEELEFEGVDSGTGANIANAICAWYGGSFTVAATDAARTSDDNLATNATITLDSDGGQPRYIVGSENGWIVKPVNGVSILLTAPHPPTEFTQVTPTATFTNGDNASGNLLVADAAYVCGQDEPVYYLNDGRSLFSATEPNGPWVAVWDQFRSATFGQFPNSNSIQAFMDGVQIGSRMYCTTAWHFDEAFRSYQIRWSPDGGATWPEANIVYERLRTAGGPWPVQIVALPDETIVAYCYGGGVLTNANGSFEFVSTGLDGPTTSPGPEEMQGGRRILNIGMLLYVIGFGDDGNKCKVSSDRGLTWSDAFTMPIQDAMGITAGVV